jgi:hypothetical protein
MCYHYRLIYGECNHSSFLHLASPCALERALDAGLVDLGCGFMWSHPLKTMRLHEALCPDCTAKKEKMHKTVGSIKEKLRKLGEDMERRTKKSRSSLESVQTDASDVTLRSIPESLEDGTPDSSVLEQEAEVVKTEGETACSFPSGPDAGEDEKLGEVSDSIADVTFTKNEYFVGGTSLSCTTLMTRDGVVLF